MWHLANPWALLASVLPIGAALYFIFRRRTTTRWAFVFSSSHRLIQQNSQRTQRLFRFFFAANGLGLVALCFFMARPVQVHREVKKKVEGIDLVIVFDVSESMEATDFQPDRMTVAKTVVRQFIERRESDRIGLVIFGGEAVTKAPLTLDYGFLYRQIEEIRMRELKQGTAIGMALANGISRLRNSQSKTKVIVLLTDGDSNVGAINPISAAQLAREERIKIYSIGIGKEDRVIVPIYAYDENNKRSHLLAQVPSYLNPELLQKISEITGGKSYMARNSQALEGVLREIDNLERTKIELLAHSRLEDVYFIPAFFVVLFMLILFVLLETRFQTRAQSYASTL